MGRAPRNVERNNFIEYNMRPIAGWLGREFGGCGEAKKGGMRARCAAITPPVLLYEDQRGEAFLVLGRGDDLEQCGWTLLLHLHGLERDIEGAGVQQALHRVAEELGRRVVDVGLDDGDGGGLIEKNGKLI